MSTISSDKGEIITKAWNILVEMQPEFNLEVLAEVQRLGEPNADGLIKLSWMAGFLACMDAFESGALKPLVPPRTKAQNN